MRNFILPASSRCFPASRSPATQWTPITPPCFAAIRSSPACTTRVPSTPSPASGSPSRPAVRSEARPAVVDGVLYFGSSDGNFYAIDAKSGNGRWLFRTGGAVTSSPAIADGIAYFASRDGFLYAVDTRTGKQRWRVRLGKDLGDQNYWDYYLSSPVIVNRTLYIGSGDGVVRALDSQSGKVRWTFAAGARIRATPAVSGDTVVFATMSGHVYALSAKDGTQRWKFATQGRREQVRGPGQRHHVGTGLPVDQRRRGHRRWTRRFRLRHQPGRRLAAMADDARRLVVDPGERHRRRDRLPGAAAARSSCRPPTSRPAPKNGATRRRARYFRR